MLFLLEQSREINKSLDITGMLLYAGGNFIQLLEGPKESVEEIYDRITHDDRNKNNIVIIKKDKKQRLFDQWSMGYRRLTRGDKTLVEGYTEFLDKDIQPEEIAVNQDTILKMFYEFKEGNTG